MRLSDRQLVHRIRGHGKLLIDISDSAASGSRPSISQPSPDLNFRFPISIIFKHHIVSIWLSKNLRKKRNIIYRSPRARFWFVEKLAYRVLHNSLHFSFWENAVWLCYQNSRIVFGLRNRREVFWLCHTQAPASRNKQTEKASKTHLGANWTSKPP